MWDKLFAEFFGTYIFLLSIIITGNPLIIGLTLAFAIYILGGISGGNFNPAATVMLVIAKKQPKSDLIPYIIFQLLAAFAAFETYKLLKCNKVIK